MESATDRENRNRLILLHYNLTKIETSAFCLLAQSFPTPMEEPKKVLKAQYLGSTEVNQPTGMEVLNTAIETALNDTKPEQWENVNVAVAPSMISINSSEVSRKKNIQFIIIKKNRLQLQNAHAK